MTILRGFGITIPSAVGFGIGGALVGYLVGLISPGYYRTVFNIPTATLEEMAVLGVALGLTQGLGAGLAAGLIIVLIVAWYNARLQFRQPSY